MIIQDVCDHHNSHNERKRSFYTALRSSSSPLSNATDKCQELSLKRTQDGPLP